MKFFAVLAVCLAVANARPDVSGYAYPKPPVGYSNENYIAQPPLISYSGDSSNTQFLTVPGQSKTTFTTVTRGGGFDGGNSFTSGGGGGSSFTSGGGGGSSYTSGGGSGNSFTSGGLATDGVQFGSVGGLDSGVNRVSGGNFGSSGTGSLGGGSVTTNEYTTISGQSQGFGTGSSFGSGSLGGGGQRVTTNEYTTTSGGAQGNAGLRGTFGTGSLGGGQTVTRNEYQTVQGGSPGFGLGGSSFTGGSGSLDGRFGQQSISHHGSANFGQEKTRYVNVQTEYVTRAPIITKNFYVHAAPEDDEEIVSRQRIHVPAAQKHYKIIFIKAPQPVGYNAAAIPPPVQNEEKTIVYVLVKKPDGTNQEIEIPAPPPTPPSKPEVYFIKYKGKDATQTIQTIQNQYANQGIVTGSNTGYSTGGITSGIVPGGSTSFTNTKTVGRFSGDDGASTFTTSGGSDGGVQFVSGAPTGGSTTYTTKTVTSGGNDGGVQYSSVPTGGSSFTTNTLASGVNDGGVQYVASVPTGGSSFTTNSLTTGGNDGGVQYVASVPTGGSYTKKTVTTTTSGGDGGLQFIGSAPGGSTSYTTNTVSGGDGGGQFIASLPTSGSTSYTTKTVTTGGGGSGFGTGLRFDGDGSAGNSGVTSYTDGSDSGYQVLRFGGADGVEGGHSSTSYTASVPTTTYTSSQTVQAPSLTYEAISGGSSHSY